MTPQVIMSLSRVNNRSTRCCEIQSVKERKIATASLKNSDKEAKSLLTDQASATISEMHSADRNRID